MEPGLHLHHGDRHGGILAGVEQETLAAWTAPRTWVTNEVLTSTLMNTHLRDQLLFIHDQGADLPSAATITPTTQFHRVTGTTTITTIAAPTGSGQGGNRLLLAFQADGCAITAGAALVLTGGPFVSKAGGIIQFIWDSTLAGWVEVGRANVPAVEYDYKQITSNVQTNPTGTSEGAANTVLTGNSVTFDGARVKIEFWVSAISAVGGTGGQIQFVILRDSTVVGDTHSISWQGVGGIPVGPIKHEVFDTPTAGSHTYTVKWFSPGGSSVNLIAYAGAGGSGADLPMFQRVTRA